MLRKCRGNGREEEDRNCDGDCIESELLLLTKTDLRMIRSAMDISLREHRTNQEVGVDGKEDNVRYARLR